MTKTLVVQVQNRPGVLNRVASLFRRRGFNIESLTVGHAEKPDVSRMTIVVDTDDAGAARLEANLYKLVDLISVENVSAAPTVFRELAIVKVATTQETRPAIMQLVHVFRAHVVDVTCDSMILETVGAEDKIDGLIEVLQQYGILEMVRTGRVAMLRGSAKRKSPNEEAPRSAALIYGPSGHHEDESVSHSV